MNEMDAELEMIRQCTNSPSVYDYLDTPDLKALLEKQEELASFLKNRNMELLERRDELVAFVEQLIEEMLVKRDELAAYLEKLTGDDFYA